MGCSPSTERVIQEPRIDWKEHADVLFEKLLWGPTSVKLDDEGRLFIVESRRFRIQGHDDAVKAMTAAVENHEELTEAFIRNLHPQTANFP